MPKCSKDERVKTVESYFSRNGSLVAVQREFVRKCNKQKGLLNISLFKIQRIRLSSIQRTLWQTEIGTKSMCNSTCFIECCSRFKNVDYATFQSTRHTLLNDLKNNIIKEINRIAADILEQVMENTARRIRSFLNNNAEHLKDIIFK